MKMTYERACELTSAVNSYCFWGMGLVDRVTPIGEATLAELCEAARIVREHPGEKQPDGTTRIRTVPDERLIAANFCATHYPAGPQSDCEPIVQLPGRWLFPHGSALVHVAVNADDELETADQEAAR